MLLQLVPDGEEQHATAVRVRELASAEADRDLELVALVEELRRRADLRVDVVLVDLRRDPDLLPGHRALLLLGVLGLLLELVAVLPEVEDAAHRRLGRRRDLDEVVPLFLRLRERARRGHDAQLLPVQSDEADGRDADLIVDPQLGRGYREAPVRGVRSPLAALGLPVERLQLGRVYHRRNPRRRSFTGSRLEIVREVYAQEINVYILGLLTKAVEIVLGFQMRHKREIFDQVRENCSLAIN